ncbi:SDR family NAD(P)-dependent oxidoreductase [Thermoanaerobacter uzonensis]|uniref:SDR family NAD(P)-dependent oxidoreductase n=1 Tax=Thermoanaerobacter uzonensis TaxID=447593 RepID=UPI003D767852
MRFEDKVVFITGAAKGIGKAISQGFAEEGALLALSDLDIDELERTAEELSNVAKVIKTYKLDVTKEIMVEKVIEEVIKDFQKIDILINNAGVSTMNYFWDLTEEEWDFNMNVNAKGVWLVSKYVVPYMIKEKKGKIVNTASMAGKIGAPLLAHYSASKFAVIGFTQAAAKELAPYGINVNAVCPGFVKTSMQDREVIWEAKLRGISDPEEVRTEYIKQTPLGRLCYPEDVARVVLFLASDDADFMTGQAINVTGGACMH